MAIVDVSLHGGRSGGIAEVAVPAVSDSVRARADTAIRLGRCFGASAQLRTNLQSE